MGLKEGEEASEGAPASEADGRSPREPGITLASSERLGVQRDERLFSRTRKSGLTCPRTDSLSRRRH